MAKTRQFTIAVENRPGAVAEIARALGIAKVNILALLGTAQGTSGTVQLIVDDTKRAKRALEAANLSYKETVAEEIELPNRPGALAQFLEKVARKDINLSSVWATTSKSARKATVTYTAEAEKEEFVG